MEKKKYTIEISGTYNSYVEKELSEEEYALIKELCDTLQTGYEGLYIHEGWGLGVSLGF